MSPFGRRPSLSDAASAARDSRASSAIDHGEDQASGAATETGSTLRETGRVVIDRLADQVLPALIAHLEASPLGELEVREHGWRIRIRRAPEAPQASSGSGAAPSRTSSAERSSGAAAGTASGTSHPSRPSSEAIVTSPAVGYFAARAELVPGLPVRSGDLLGQIDVLGVKQEVIAEADGVVGGVLVEVGQAVEYGQELIRINRLDRSSQGAPRGGSTDGQRNEGTH